jgi:hypothetical protein
MKWTALVPAVCLATLVTSCGETTAPVVPPAKLSPAVMLQGGTVLVYVHWGDQGIPDKLVELVELGKSLMTDEEGFAQFVVSPGDYTVRAYDINRGPTWEYIDTEVTVAPGEELFVEIVDCIPCD